MTAKPPYRSPNIEVKLPVEPVEHQTLKIARVPTTDHEYNRLLKAIKAEAEHDPARSGPVAERIMSLYEQLSSGKPASEPQKLRTGPGSLGWQDQEPL